MGMEIFFFYFAEEFFVFINLIFHMEFFLLVFHNSPAAWLFPLLDKKIIFPIFFHKFKFIFYMKSFSDEKWRCEDEKAAGFWRNDHFSLKCVSC
jgi:hypothetical protein